MKLNLQESKGYFLKAATLLKPLGKVLRERVQFGFIRLRQNMIEQREANKSKMLADLEGMSSISNKHSVTDSVDSHFKSSTIKVSYVRVKVNP